jgi:hypothetical protein
VVGVELEYFKLTSFSGIGDAPSTDSIVGFTSLRFYFSDAVSMRSLAQTR